ncbi:MAG: pyridoxamine 5'-phosphate oxidase family protein [Candidatus Eremiobacteraeota bacterium]|nr:pyridoxamine 5'-phosphate oxidase family protein [Candidatus Eremiobacteraeota bacterium]
MTLKDYLSTKRGIGVLATVDKDGKPDLAYYAQPFYMGDETIAFIMADRLTHKNTGENPHAAYLFYERDAHFKGRRFFLTKLKEETDKDKMYELMKERDSKMAEEYKEAAKFLVYFHVDKVLDIFGDCKDQECF